MRLGDVAEASRAVAGTAGRLEKIGHLAGLLSRVPPDEIAIVIAFLSGEPRQGRMKIGGAVLSGLRDVPRRRSAAAGAPRGRCHLRSHRRPLGRRSASGRAQLLRDLMRSRDRRRAGLPRPPALRRAATGRARRRADRRGRPRRPASGARASAARRCWPATSRRSRAPRLRTAKPALARSRCSRFSRSSRCWPIQPPTSARALDRARRGVVRIQAGWRAHPGPQGRRRGARVFAKPARRDDRGAGSRRRSRARCRRANRPRRRSDCAASRRRAAAVSG